MVDVDLCELFNKYGTNKDHNGYGQLFNTLFYKMRNERITILEIGIGTMIPDAPSTMVGYCCEGYKPGGSLRAWRDYFTNAQVIGIDIQNDTQFNNEQRINTFICDSTKLEDVTELMRKLCNIKFDIIIDDGSHNDMDQIATVRNFYPHLKNDGYYIIQDIYPGSKLSECPALVGCLCNHDSYFFVGVKTNICVVHKHHLKSKRANY